MDRFLFNPFLDTLSWLYIFEHSTFKFCRIFSHLFPIFKNELSHIICYLFSSAAPSLPTLPLWDIWPYSPRCSLQCIGSASSVCHQDEFEGVTVLPQIAKKAFHYCKWREQVKLLFYIDGCGKCFCNYEVVLIENFDGKNHLSFYPLSLYSSRFCFSSATREKPGWRMRASKEMEASIFSTFHPLP